MGLEKGRRSLGMYVYAGGPSAGSAFAPPRPETFCSGEGSCPRPVNRLEGRREGGGEMVPDLLVPCSWVEASSVTAVTPLPWTGSDGYVPWWEEGDWPLGIVTWPWGCSAVSCRRGLEDICLWYDKMTPTSSEIVFTQLEGCGTPLPLPPIKKNPRSGVELGLCSAKLQVFLRVWLGVIMRRGWDKAFT